MFIVALFTIAKTWNPPKCPSVIDWIKKMCHIYTMEYYAAMKMDEFLSFRDMNESGNHHSQQIDQNIILGEMSKYRIMHAVCGFLFLRQFAENDSFQFHPRSCKGHELIFFYGCIVFRGVYVSHFPCPVYHRWAFGLVPGLCYCKQCCNEHLCARVLIVERFVILWIYTQ